MAIKKYIKHINFSAEDIAAGKYGAWDLIEPMWDAVWIYDGKDKYDSDLEPFTEAQRRALAWVWYNNEVFNGGHQQFLINSTGIVWKDALECMEIIGAEEAANRFSKIVSAFGGEIPYERAERIEAFDKLWDSRNSTFPSLIEMCDKEYMKGDRADIIVEMLENYMRSHAEEFVLNGDFEFHEIV